MEGIRREEREKAKKVTKRIEGKPGVWALYRFITA
jgi:hypothetical protein